MADTPPSWIFEWLSDNGHRAEQATGLRITSRIESPLGCGSYGCVYKTDSPRWVLKVTDDPDEGPLMASIIALRQRYGGGDGYGPSTYLPGIVFVRNIFQAFWEEDEPIYVVVREEVKPWGSDDWHRMVYYEAEKNKPLEARPVPAPQGEGQTSMTIVQECAKLFNRRTSIKGKEQALLKYIEWLGIASEELPIVAESMLELFDHEIVLEDVHEANLGYAHVNWGPQYRRPGRVVIHDVGLSETPIQARFLRLNPIGDASFGRGKHKWLPLDQVLAWEPLAAELGVSRIARSRDGFVRAYEDGLTPDALAPYWADKRERFLTRMLAQAKARQEPWYKNGVPTRRHLALIMWGHSPVAGKLGKPPRPNPIETTSAPENDAPGWLRYAFEKSDAKIAKLHGRKMLPKSWEMYGCGSFGCVLPTRDPKWVCKVGIEGSEAFFAKAQAKLNLYPKGVARYKQPIRVESRLGPMWIGWRQAIEPPSFDTWFYENRVTPAELNARIDDLEFNMDVSDRRLLSNMRLASELREQWHREKGTDAYEILNELQNKGLGVAMRLDWFSNNVDDRPAMFAKELEARREEAVSLFDPEYKAPYWSYAKRDVSRDTMLDAALDLLGYRFHLGRLRGHKLMGPLAQALESYLKEGLLLADPQPSNIAKINGVWSLFDAGFTVPISRRWNAMWLDEDVHSERWFSNSRFELWGKLAELSGEPGYAPNPTRCVR